MKNKTRELMLTKKKAQDWKINFEREVNLLMQCIDNADQQENIEHATELMNVYQFAGSHSSGQRNIKQRKKLEAQPFAFLTFLN